MGDIKKYEEFESNESVQESLIENKSDDYVEEIGNLEDTIMNSGNHRAVSDWDDISVDLLDDRDTWDELEHNELLSAIDQARAFMKKNKIQESLNEALSLDFERKFASAMDSVDDVRTEIEMTLEDTPQLKSFYTVDAQLDKALRSYKLKIKRILSTVPESTNEAADFSRSYRKRMEGLTNQRELKSMLTAANMIVKDLMDDGFDKSEAVEFVTYKIEQDNGIRF